VYIQITLSCKSSSFTDTGCPTHQISDRMSEFGGWYLCPSCYGVKLLRITLSPLWS